MSRYTHVIFDLDGTVFDSNHANLQSLADALQIVCPQNAKTYAELVPLVSKSANAILEVLHVPQEKHVDLIHKWCECSNKYQDEVKPFNHVLEVMSFLKRRGIFEGIATSRDRNIDSHLANNLHAFPVCLRPYVDLALCVADVAHPKPAPDLLQKYLQQSGANPNEVLYVGDTADDLACAKAAGVDFALAMWGYCGRCSIKPTWFLTTPWDLVSIVFSRNDEDAQWFAWAREIQAIGQIGLAYTKDVFDMERFTRLREIACEMVALKSAHNVEEVQETFSFDKGYACPKVDTRAAVFDDLGRILMVRERTSGKWNLPGGWCDDGQTVITNTLKELREEACMEGMPLKLIAVLDRNRHNVPKFTYGVIKVFIECKMGAHYFKPTDETIDCKFFAYEDLPLEELRLGTNSVDQLELCFAAHTSENWKPVLE